MGFVTLPYKRACTMPLIVLDEEYRIHQVYLTTHITLILLIYLNTAKNTSLADTCISLDMSCIMLVYSHQTGPIIGCFSSIFANICLTKI